MNDRKFVLHLDMDAFFASVEQITHPQWAGKPVIICGDGRSVVATASYEARKLGVKAGLPAKEARKLAPDAIYISGRHDKYLWISMEIIRILRRFSPVVEPCSIDEAFLELSGLETRKLALEIKKSIFQAFHLTCSIGIGSNKLIAKVASDFQKPDGLTIVPPEDEIEWLHTRLIHCLPGIGEKTAKFFTQRNIMRVGDLALIDENILIKWFGRNGALLYRMAWGKDDSEVLPALPALKSISQEHTLPQNSDDKMELEEVIRWLSSIVGRRLRTEGQGGRTIAVKIRDANFQTITRANTQQEYLYLDEEISNQAIRLFGHNWVGEPIRLLGVKVANLATVSNSDTQLSLWVDQKNRQRKINMTLDHLKDKYGENVLVRGAELAIGKGRK